jgi:hypothetical protein
VEVESRRFEGQSEMKKRRNRKSKPKGTKPSQIRQKNFE